MAAVVVVKEKTFKCKECGTELPSKEHLRKHQRFHKERAWKEAGYADPNNVDYPTFLNPTNSRAAFFISHLLGTDEESKKKRKKSRQQ
ncbi:hypothetical protein NTE_03222 [Candidatus Nitrososphaera evergladensis SR1]|uniref:C2H2-type domain-containing protein n=1 Tax=Candidatus Nitrososphaera evergladensis SR1 TaxID=1459636 RepID=A0A075MUC7_9ARCH|nr:C2H2-type zinc finger protein [Candidatus Nitrososphaera evergladensis]AIF85251.1 hypothetical protein NTE_03222 [Candidatus Nitrososphaera evergladensis SR1]